MKIYNFIILMVVGLFALQPKLAFSFYTKLGAVQISSYVFNESDVFNINHQNGNDFDIMSLNDDNKSELVISDFTSFTVNDKPLTIYVPQSNAVEKLVISSPTISLKNTITILGKPIDIVFVSSNNISCSNCGFKNAGRISFLTGTFLNDIIDVKANSIISINGLLAAGAQSLEVFSDKINTSGVIDLNLKATTHPAGGYIISDNGNLVAGAGGINLYAGDFRIRYSDLDIQDVNIGSGTYQPKGNFKAASIGIVSARNIEIPVSTELNTMSDMLATTTRANSFYAPSEGIFIQVARNKSASISLNGKFYSDNIITAKNFGALNIGGKAKIVGRNYKVLTNGAVSNYGFIEADEIGFFGSKFINSGVINGYVLNIETVGDVYNSFGGNVLVGKLNVSIENGIFTNGSRTDKRYLPNKKSLLTPSLDMTSSKHGIYYKLNEKGLVQSDLSANIHANEIRIKAAAIENINPYNLNKENESWDSGIKVNTAQANQVTMIAEIYMGLKGTRYVRNSSAILGLSQQGNFEVNTLKFYNERYRLEADSFVVSQLTYDSVKTGKFDEANVGTETKVIGYSAPGRVFSYGKLKVSDGNSINEDEEFINAFSYVEIFADSHFHQLELKTVGLELTKNISESHVSKIRYCMMWRNCTGKTVTSFAEAETLLSLQGNIYGLNEQVVTETDYVQENINILEIRTKEVIDKYLAQYIYHTDDLNFGKVSHVKADNDWLTGTKQRCFGLRFLPYVGKEVPNCESTSFKAFIPTLLEKAIENNFVGDTGFTHAQIKKAATNFIQTLPKKEDPRKYFSLYLLTLENTSLSSYALDSQYKIITITYRQSGKARTPGIGIGYRDYTFTFTETANLATVMSHL